MHGYGRLCVGSPALIISGDLAAVRSCTIVANETNEQQETGIILQSSFFHLNSTLTTNQISKGHDSRKLPFVQNIHCQEDWRQSLSPTSNHPQRLTEPLTVASRDTYTWRQTICGFLSCQKSTQRIWFQSMSPAPMLPPPSTVGTTQTINGPISSLSMTSHPTAPSTA